MPLLNTFAQRDDRRDGDNQVSDPERVRTGERANGEERRRRDEVLTPRLFEHNSPSAPQALILRLYPPFWEEVLKELAP